MNALRRSAALVACTTAAAAVLIAGCADPASQHGRAGIGDAPHTSTPDVRAAVPSATTSAACPSGDTWQNRPRAAKTTPEALALAVALDPHSYPEYAATYGNLVVDYPVGRVALCFTDPAAGHRMAEAAKKAHPGIDLGRLDVYRSRYSERTLLRAVDTMSEKTTVAGFPIYTLGPANDASGIDVTTTAQGARSAALHNDLSTLAGGIPVHVREGGQPVSASY